MSVVRFARFCALLLPLIPATLTADEEEAVPNRGISANLASALSQTLPKYNPPPPKPEKEEEDDDSALGIKPKNGIVRLPRVVVEGERPPVFTEREVSTDKGLSEIAIKRYFSDVSQALNKYHIPWLTASQEELAMMMWEEDERLRLLQDLSDQSDNAFILNGEEEAKELKQLSDETLGRQSFLPDAAALNREKR